MIYNIMYKPPQNNNRVRSLRNKFENLEKNNSEPAHNGCGNNLNKTPKEFLKEAPILQRQTSDPLKNNIKRTPAFRVDKSIAENCGLQRNCFNKSGMLESKLRLYTTIKNNCDNWIKNGNNSDDDNEVPSNKLTESLITSRSFHNNESLCKKVEDFGNNDTENKSHLNPISKNVFEKNISYLYTEPIPKALRNKNLMDSNIIEKDSEIHNISTLKLSDDVDQKKENNISSQLLTDTLRTALKKPLPSGPAPQKPPRTFQHVQKNCDIKKNISFVPSINNGERGVNLRSKSKQKKTDAKYMLNKLENALKNNKLYVKKQYKTDISTTSGEDSDDSLLFKSKSNKVNGKLAGHSSDNVNSPTFNLNCLRLMNCSRSDYEMINQPGSSFFIDPPDQPIYVEPYHYLKNDESDLKSDRKSL